MTKVSQTELIAGAIAGKIVSFPTDTLPALAVKPDCGQLIFAAKGRPTNKPLILMGASFQDFFPYIKGNSEELEIWQQVAQKYLPGALTLVLPASVNLPVAMNPTDPTTIGVRIPNLKIAQDILAQTGPLGTTSANYSGEPPLKTMTEIETVFPEVLILDCEPIETCLGSGLPSTVAKWIGNDWRILRQGSVKL